MNDTKYIGLDVLLISHAIDHVSFGTFVPIERLAIRCIETRPGCGMPCA